MFTVFERHMTQYLSYLFSCIVNILCMRLSQCDGVYTVERITLGGPCSVGDKCASDNAECINGRCACLPGYVVRNRQCGQFIYSNLFNITFINRGPRQFRGPRPPTNRRPPTKPFQFYFSLMIDAYESGAVYQPLSAFCGLQFTA